MGWVGGGVNPSWVFLHIAYVLHTYLYTHLILYMKYIHIYVYTMCVYVYTWYTHACIYTYPIVISFRGEIYLSPGGRAGIDWGGDTPRYYTKPQKTIQSPKLPPTDNTKPRQTIQSPDRLYKAPKRPYKDLAYQTKPQVLNKTKTFSTKTSTHLTRQQSFI